MVTKNKARVLIWDIETSYIVGGTWGTWNTNVVTVIQDWQILCFAYKWLGEKKIYVIGQDDYQDYKPGVLNDRNVVKEIYKLFCEADVIIAHNGNSFDQKKAQARMMVHGLPPPSPYYQIDTKVAMKRVANHTSNKLFDLAKSLELTHKLDAGGIETWTGCMNGNKKAWKRMKTYNKGDIVTLEELYLNLRPWINNHPPMNNFEGRPKACPKCGAEGYMQSRGVRTNKINTYRQYQCQVCRGWSRMRLAEYQQAEERMEYV